MSALGSAEPDDRPNADPRGQAECLSQVLRAVRSARQMRASEVAKAMGMASRSYQHFEAGRGRLDFLRIERFAEATGSDPYAIVVAVMLRRPDLALNAMYNKLVVMNLFALDDFNEELGEDIRLIEPQILVGAFRRVFQDLSDYVRKRDLSVDRWLDDRARRAGLPFNIFRRPRKGS